MPLAHGAALVVRWQIGGYFGLKEKLAIPMLAACLLGCFGCGSKEPAQAGGVPGGYSIHGHVVDWSTKQPVAGATLSVKRDDGMARSATTDGSGDAVFQLPPATKPHIVLEAQKQGYTNYFQHIFRTSGDIPLTIYLKQGPAEGVKPVKPKDSPH